MTLQYLDPTVRAAAIHALQSAERQHGVRILHAAVVPASGDPRENNGEEWQLRASFVRQTDAYMAIDGQMPMSQATAMAPNVPLRVLAMDARDSFASVRSNPAGMAMAALSPYLDAISAEQLARNSWIESIAPRMAALGPKSRQSLDDALKLRVSTAHAYYRGDFGQRAPAPGGFGGAAGGFGTPVVGLTEATRQRYIVSTALVALAARAALAQGELPTPDSLDFPPNFQQMGIPPLRNCLSAQTLGRAELERVEQMVNQHLAARGPAFGGGGATPFGRPLAAPDEGEAALAAIVNRGLVEQIRDATAGFHARPVEELMQSYLADGQIRPMRAPEAPAFQALQQQPLQAGVAAAEPAPAM